MSRPASILPTKSTSLFKSYPWHNGIALAHDRHAIVVEGFARSEKRPDRTVEALVRNLALRVDHTDKMEVHDANIREFLQRTMGLSGHGWKDDRSQTVDRLHTNAKRSHAHLIYLADIFFPYRLLDIFAAAYDFYPNHQPPVMTRLSVPEIRVRRLEKIYDALSSWTKLISDFGHLHRHQRDLSKSGSQTAGQCLPLPADADESKTLFMGGLQCLWSSSLFSQKQKYTKIMTNIMMLASAVWWYGMGFDTIPMDKELFLEYVAKRAAALNVSPDSWGIIKQMADLQTILPMMRNIFHIAASVSPLVVLAPKKPSLEGIRRDHLIGHGAALGNQRPASLKNVEYQLWMAVANIATGGNPTVEMENFLLSAESHIKSDKEYIEDQWYTRGLRRLCQAPVQFGTSAHGDGDIGEIDVDSVGGLDVESGKGKRKAGKGQQDEGGWKNRLGEKEAEGQQSANGINDEHNAKSLAESESESESESDGQEYRHWRPHRKQRIPRIEEIYDSVGERRRLRHMLAGIARRRTREPDLPMITVPMQLQKQNQPSVEVVLKEEKNADTSVRVLLHKAHVGTSPLEYEFKAWENTADVEHQLLTKIMKSVKRNFWNGQPPHHHPQAQEILYTNQRSSIFVTTPDKLHELKARQVQEIFRDRHVLVAGGTSQTSHFDRHALSRLGSLTASHNVQVNSSKNTASLSQMLHTGTLLDMLPGPNGKSKRGLNILDIPMGGANIPKPPLYSYFASNEEAWQQARDIKGINSFLPFPSDSMIWGTASTQDSTTWLHIDDQGLGTAVTVVAGMKYWVLAVPKKKPLNGTRGADLGTIDNFGEGWALGSASEMLWDYEGVLLCPGDTLYMRPCTPHYVLTVQDAIVHGQHMFSSSTSQSTLYGVIHTFVLGLCITNQLHDLLTLLRRLLAMWLVQYREDPDFDRTAHPHVPDVLTEEGLKDIMAIGNLVDLGGVIDRRYYMISGITVRERIEMGSCRSMYRQLQSVLVRKFTFHVGGHPIIPLLVFRRSLVELAAAVVTYKEEMDSVHVKSAHSAVRVKEKMLAHFRTNHPDLLPRLMQLVNSHFKCFSWTGPEIKITRRTDQNRIFSVQKLNTPAMLLNRKVRDFLDVPLYHEPAPSENFSPQEEEKEEEQGEQGEEAPAVVGLTSESHQTSATEVGEVVGVDMDSASQPNMDTNASANAADMDALEEAVNDDVENVRAKKGKGRIRKQPSGSSKDMRLSHPVESEGVPSKPRLRHKPTTQPEPTVHLRSSKRKLHQQPESGRALAQKRPRQKR